MADLVAREELAQRDTGGIPAVTDHRYARLVRLGRNSLEPSHAFARERTHFERDLRRYGGNGVILLSIHAHHARGFRGSIAARERRAEGKRHLAENGPRKPPAERTFDAVEHLDDLDFAGENRVESAVATF